MRAVVITKHGDLSVLGVQERPDPPPPGPGQVRIAVRAAGVNFADHLARVGLYPDAPKPPAVVGYEVAGTIDAVGDGVDPARAGERSSPEPGSAATRRSSTCRRQMLYHGRRAELRAGARSGQLHHRVLSPAGYGSLRSGERVLVHTAAAASASRRCSWPRPPGRRCTAPPHRASTSDSPSWASTAPSTTAATAGGKACRRTTSCWTPSAASR